MRTGFTRSFWRVVLAVAPVVAGIVLAGTRRPARSGFDDALARALLKSDATLEAEIVAALKAQTAAQEARIAGIIGVTLEAYRSAKRYLYAAPGQGFAYFLNRFGDGGADFCRRTRYCQRRAKVAKELKEIGQIPDEFLPAAGKAAEFVEDRMPESFGLLKECAEFMAEELGDALIVPIAARVVHSGLEQICRCCTRCKGVGVTSGKKCPACKGTGEAPREQPGSKQDNAPRKSGPSPARRSKKKPD